MKNMKRKRLVESSLLFLIVGFLMLFSPLVGKAQYPSSACGKGYKYVEVQEPAQKEIYGNDPRTGIVRWHYAWVWKWVGKCVPTPAETNSGTSSRANSTYPNVVRNADGTFRPAGGYQWLIPKDPNDFRVKLMPGLIKSKSGKLLPASGYQWVSPNNPKDFRVERVPGHINPNDLFDPRGYRWLTQKISS